MGDIFQFHLLLSLVGTLLVTAIWFTGTSGLLWTARRIALASGTAGDGKQDGGHTLPRSEAQAGEQQPQEAGV